VQIPCIERNAIGAVKLSTPRMALDGDGRYRVPLDSVIRTLAQTGVDMKSKYKERAHGGPAVNVVLC
jgi:L-serine dehydratase